MTFQLSTDHHVSIGRMHLSDGKPCQDHALSGVIKEYGQAAFAYAVVSDGCSSAGETDIGARLLTTLTAKALNNNPQSSYLIHEAIDLEAYDAGVTLGLGNTDLYATHLYAVVDIEGQGYVHVRGDGAVAFLYSSGAIGIYKFEWANNMPFYPLYSPEGFQNFNIAHGGPDAKALSVSVTTITADGQIAVSEPVEHTVTQGTMGITLPINGTHDLSMIALFSDGIFQIDKQDWIESLSAVTAFKNRSGNFVKRRVINFLKDKAGNHAALASNLNEALTRLNAGDTSRTRQYVEKVRDILVESASRGRGALDDLSVAVIALVPVDTDKDPARISNPSMMDKPAELPVVPLSTGVE